MSQIEAYSPPPMPPQLANGRTFQDLRDGVRIYLAEIANYHTTYFTRFGVSHNKNAQGFAPNIVAATTIQVTADLQQIVTGTATIQTIQPPPNFNGLKALYAQNGFTLGTAGNIATAFTAAAGNLVFLAYFPPTGKWAVFASAFVGTLDGIPDGALYAKVSVNALTANNVDMNKIGVVNKSTVANTAGAGVDGAGKVATAGLNANAATYSATPAVYGGTLVINGVANPFDTWIDVPSSSISIQINAATDHVFIQSWITIDYSGLQPGNLIQHRIIDDLGNVYVNPATNITVQLNLNSNGTFQGLPTVDVVVPPAGAYPATRVYHLQAYAHQAIATFSASVTAAKMWGWDRRA